MKSIELRTFTEEEYHLFFKDYIPDPVMDSSPFVYNREQISRSYYYNHDKTRNDYLHFGIFCEGKPIGSFQLKRIDYLKKHCEFGIILQNDRVKNQGFGTEAIRLGMIEAKSRLGMETISGDTMKRNLRMQRVFIKLGFQLIEINHHAFILPDGTKEDRLVYVKNLTEEMNEYGICCSEARKGKASVFAPSMDF